MVEKSVLLRRFHRPVRWRHLGARGARAAQGGLRPITRRCRRIPAADHRRPGQRGADTAVRRVRRRRCCEFLEQLSAWFEFVWKPGLCRLLPGVARRLRTRQHHQRAAHRPAEAGRRRAEAAPAAGAGAQGNLAGAQGASDLLPDPAVVGRQGRAAQADRADGQGEGVRRADGGDRTVAGGPAADWR